MTLLEFMQSMGSSDIPLVAAFFIGLMTAISPCPLTTNITAIAYISKKIGYGRHTLVVGLVYTFGRMVAYVLVASLVLWVGLSSQYIALLLQQYGEILLGPFFILLGVLMLTADRFQFSKGCGMIRGLGEKYVGKGYLGGFVLGFIFSLSFCPFSAVLFFGMLIPLAMAAGDPIIVPSVFAIATALPVLFFSVLLVYSVSRVGIFVNKLQIIEKSMRKVTALVFILAGFNCLRLLF
jgi:cytochrome c-type biogenesis protein